MCSGMIPMKASEIYTLIRILIILKRPKTKPSTKLIPMKRKRSDISPAIFFGTLKEVKKSRNEDIEEKITRKKNTFLLSVYLRKTDSVKMEKSLKLHKSLLLEVYYLYP